MKPTTLDLAEVWTPVPSPRAPPFDPGTILMTSSRHPCVYLHLQPRQKPSRRCGLQHLKQFPLLFQMVSKWHR